MRNKVVAALAAVVLACTTTVATAPAANADYWCKKQRYSNGWYWYWTICPGDPPPIKITYPRAV